MPKCELASTRPLVLSSRIRREYAEELNDPLSVAGMYLLMFVAICEIAVLGITAPGKTQVAVVHPVV
jgi:hypothetical protein